MVPIMNRGKITMNLILEPLNLGHEWLADEKKK